MKYELVSGLETHIELSTKTKIFCGCTTAFGAEPNTNCCPICIGLPGTLPKLNRQAVRYAILAGLATNCKINPMAKMDRKNYVYPDLSKAYQISQYDKPLCYEGYVTLDSGKRIRITRIHIEEDAGKLVHQRGDTYVDYNRAGVPLIEVVTEPDIRSIEEAREYVEKLQLIMRYIGVSDCKMQEGSLRCDVNVSVRPAGSEKLGTRTEIKNMNSFTHMSRAMQYEMDRQIDLLESGEAVVQETLRYDEASGVTESMRGKEDAQDYRYFREPDLVSIETAPEEIKELRALLPELPDDKLRRYINEYHLSAADAQNIVKYRRIAEFFDQAAQGVNNPKTVSNFIIGQLFGRFDTEAAKEEFRISIPPAYLGELALLADDGKLNANMAKATLEKMLDSGKPASQLLTAEDLAGVDDAELTALCQKAIDANADAVASYKAGREKALKVLIGMVMRETRGRANAQQVEQIILQIIN